MLEYEFRGLDGLPDIQGETFEITDGINTQNIINKVTSETAITVSSNSYPHTGKQFHSIVTSLLPISPLVVEYIEVSAFVNWQLHNRYFEKSGSLIAKFNEYYLTGIKDRQSQAIIIRIKCSNAVFSIN